MAEGEGNGNASGEVTWRSALPEDMRDNASLRDFPDVSALAKSFIDTQAYVGNSVRIPTDDASDEAKQEFYDKILAKAPGVMKRPNLEDPVQSTEFYRSLGAPESADGYEIPTVDGIKLPDERAKFLKEMAYKNGMSKTQFKNMVTMALEQDKEMVNANSRQVEDSMKKLKDTWGLAFEERMKTAAKLAKETGAPPELMEAIANNEVRGDVYEWLWTLNTQLGKETVELAGSGGGERVMSPAEADEQVNEIMGNKKHPYWDKSHPGHQGAVEKVIKLMRMVKPKS